MYYEARNMLKDRRSPQGERGLKFDLNKDMLEPYEVAPRKGSAD